MEERLAKQFAGDSVEDSESLSSEQSAHETHRQKRRLESPPAHYDDPEPAIFRSIGLRDTFQTAAKRAFEGVPGILHTIQRIQQHCLSSRNQEAFQELQVLILQDKEYPALKPSEKTKFLHELLGMLSRQSTAGMDNRIKLKLFEIIKRMFSDTVQRSSTQTLFSSAEEAFCGPLHEHKATLDAKLSAIATGVANKDDSFHYECEDDVFLIDKILYNVEASKKLLEAGFQFAKARKEKGKVNHLENLFAKIGGAATCDGECIGWLVAHGLKFAWQTAAAGAASKKTAAQILIIEKYNDLVLKQPEGRILVEQAKLWISDLGFILSARFADFRPNKDWLIAYACMECLLNIAFRFPEAQQEVVKVLSQPFNLKVRGSMNVLKRVRDAFDDTQSLEFQRRIRFKHVEALAQLQLWGQEDLQKRLNELLDEHRAQGAPIPNDTRACWRHFMSQDRNSHATMLSAPAAADFIWAETALAACGSLFKREPLLEANSILQILNQQFILSGSVDLCAAKLVNYSWAHMPQDVVQDLDDAMRRLPMGTLTPDVCRQLFLRTLVLACSCTMKSIRIPDHLGLQDCMPCPGHSQSSFDQEVAEDVIASSLSGTGGEADSDDASQTSDEVPPRNDGSVSSLEEAEVVVEVSPAQLASVQRSIRTITQHIEQGSASEAASGLRNVVVVGVTGSGKSTMVNALAGCTIRQLEQEEAEVLMAPLDAVTVVPCSEGGVRDPVSKIGHHTQQSETEVLRAIEILPDTSQDQSFMLWDAPGFLDSHGPEINIANAVNLTNLLKMSQQDGLVVVVVLDGPSLTAGRGSNLKDTVKILVHLLGDENEELNSSFLSGILFCVTKTDPTRHGQSSVREWVVNAAPEGLDLDGHRNQILIFDPLNRNGCGPADIRKRLMGMRPMRRLDKVFSTSLTDTDTNLLAKIAHVLSIDVATSLEKCDFESVRTHLSLFNSLLVIANPTVEQYSLVVFGSIEDRAKKWSYYLKDHMNDFNLTARKQIRGLLDKLKQAQILEDTLQHPFSIKALYVECYQKIQRSERQRQAQENQDLETSFTKAKARLRSALAERSACAPEFFRHFDISRWGCADCVRNYASMKEVQDLKAVLDKAGKFAAGRMPDQLYVFGDQGDLTTLMRTFEDHVLQLFQEARNRSRGTLLNSQFSSVLGEVKAAIAELLHPAESDQIQFFSTAPLRAPDVLSLVLQGLDPLAETLHGILVELQSRHPEVHQRRVLELEQYFDDVHQQAVDIKVEIAAKKIRNIQDAFVKTVEGSIKDRVENIGEGGQEYLKAELQSLHPEYDKVWAEVLDHMSFASVTRAKRALLMRECKLMDELVLSAETFVNKTAAEIQDTEMKVRGCIERLKQLAFEVVKVDYAHLMIRRIAVADILDLQWAGFEEALVSELDALLKRMAALDKTLFRSLSAELELFLEHLMLCAESECAAVHLQEAFAAFEEQERAKLSETAKLIVDGQLEVLSHLRRSVEQYQSLWETLRVREAVPTVADTIRRLEREEREIVGRLQTEAGQFLGNLAADRKQRELQFESSLMEIRKELQKVARKHHKKLRTVHIENVSQLSEFGFDSERVMELSSLMIVMKKDDRPAYSKRSKQLSKFFVVIQQLADAFYHSAQYSKGLTAFCRRIREDIYDKAPQLASGGRPALEQELDATFPEHAELCKVLIEGPLKEQPAVKQLAASAQEERESLMSQLVLDLENHVNNLAASRKQLHQQFDSHLLSLKSATNAIAKHCEMLAVRQLGEQDVLVLHDFGFDKTAVDAVSRLLEQFRTNDVRIYPQRRGELLNALEAIRCMATDMWVERLKTEVFDQLEKNKALLLGEIDALAASIVDGSIVIKEKLMPPSTEGLVSQISSFQCERAQAACQHIEAQMKRHSESVRDSANERLAILEKQARMQRREDITAKITNLITRLPKHQEKDQRELATELDNLLDFDGRSPAYQQMVEAVQSQLEVMQDHADIQRMIGSEDFIGLNARVQMLDRLRDLLTKKHLKVNVKIDEAVTKQMNSLVAEVHQELDADIYSSSYLRFTRLRYFCTIYEAVKATFSNLHTTWEMFLISADKKLENMITRVRDITIHEQVNNDLSVKSQHAVARLLIKGYGVSFELHFVEKFKELVQRHIIRKCGDRQKYQIGAALMQYATEHSSEDDGVKEMARMIIDTFPAFKSFNIALFNAKAGGITFNDALGKLVCQGPCNHAALLQAYAAYSAAYNELVNQIVQDLDGFPREKVRDQILANAKGLALYATKLGSKIDEFGKLLGQVCGLWTYLSCRGTSSGLEKRYVLQPHSTQVLGILRLLGLDQASLANHLIQINTGEGKSIALGFTATLLALLGFRVDVVCYSRYLSERDHNAFTHLFKFLTVDKKISYSDFDLLSSRIMKDGALDFPDMRQVFCSFLKGHKYKHSPKQKGDSVLLMDEVDVFFSDAFYGMTYNPTASLDEDADAYRLVVFVWENRERLYDGEKSVAELLARPEAKSLRKRYPRLTEKLLRVQLRKMLQAVKLFPGSGPPKLQGMHDFVLEDQRIGYQDPVSGVPNFSWSYGYVTAFTYLHCVQRKELQLDKVKKHVTLQFDCGSLLYSRIPSFYSVCLGMTGTLDCLSAAQNNLLSKFGFARRTHLPSTFKKQGLNTKEQAEAVSTIVESGSYDEYFERIKRELEEQVKRGRATLVVFEDQPRLERFERELKLRQPDLPEYKPHKVLSDKLKSSDRDYVVVLAIRKFATTLVTRSYGRGTDFVCRDEGLVKNGGVHLIVTFYPQDESESKQIYGRTCRQDNPGSARRILFEDDLKHLSATEIDKESSALSWDEYLARKRADKEADRYDAMTGSEQQNTQNHNNTLQVCRLVENGQWEAAASVFEKFGEARYQAFADRFRPASGVCRLMCLSDATGSMQRLWASALENINEVLQRIDHIAAGRGVLEIKWVAFRDYDTTILEESGWTADASSLASFLGGVRCDGGADFEEGIDCALHCANNEPQPPTQVLLIGDAPPHVENVGEQIKGCGNATLLYDYKEECRQLKAKNIPVHTFALGDNQRTKAAFEEIAALTGGRFQEFSVDNLLDVLCLQALDQIGGSELTNKYKKEYMGLSHT